MVLPDLDITINDERYLTTIKELRLRNFSRDLPFLILSDKLPDGQVYREYSDGRMELQQVFSIGAKFESKVLSILNPADADQVRREYGLL